MYNHSLPARVRLLVIGGGIHGVGVLHDLASRGWQDIHLVDKGQIGNATSSRSTKLIHGGLRYLRNLTDYGLVHEALHERALLMDLAGDLVKPLELYLPILKSGGMPALVMRAGLTLYDLLAGKRGLHRHRVVSSREELDRQAPTLALDNVRKVFSFWDGQTDDLSLVRRVAASAVKLGAQISEGNEVTNIRPSEDGWTVDVRRPDGSSQVVSALYVLNAAGPWANRLLEASKLKVPYRGVNSKGAHLLFKDIGNKVGLFLQSPEDKRIFFVLPWCGYTMVGTTEDLFHDDPDQLSMNEQDVEYLLQHCNRYLKSPLRTEDIVGEFAGLRWLAVDEGRSLGNTSRAYVIGEQMSQRGLLMTLYGGKLTTYRNLSKSIGDRITAHFGEFRPSKTHDPKTWVAVGSMSDSEDVLQRFLPGGLAYTRRRQAIRSIY